MEKARHQAAGNLNIEGTPKKQISARGEIVDPRAK
jgi:hypothetical protein